MTAVRLICAGFGLALLMTASAQGQGAGQPRHDDVRQAIIEDSVQAHGGYCVCPWQKDRKGQLCGARSLYNREGIVPPQCYPKDVDDESVEAWLNEKHEIRRH